jgi:hypothetical protein
MAHVARIDLSISLNGLGIIRYYVPMISSVAGGVGNAVSRGARGK